MREKFQWKEIGMMSDNDWPVVPSLRVWSLNEQVLFIFPNGERQVYTLAQIDAHLHAAVSAARLAGSGQFCRDPNVGREWAI
jgi:hypothetical protein